MSVLSKTGCETQRTERLSALVELKPGSARNLFLVHDGDGDTDLYSSLARRMPDEVAVFGIKPRTIERVPLAHVKIEDMANSYLEEIRKKQSHGPYLLGGLCAGGVIAYEMASQLLQKGESVELLALLDAATPHAPKRRGRITKERFGRTKEAFGGPSRGGHWTTNRVYSLGVLLSRKLGNAVRWEIAQLGQRFWARVRFRFLQEVLARGLSWPEHLPELTTRQIYECAEAGYVPRQLSGARALLVRARRRTPIVSDTPFSAIYADETLGWDALIQDLIIADVDGGHGTMLQEPFVQSLAKALLHQLNFKSDDEHAGPFESARPALAHNL
jgi:thioesterase domain-containing protein